MADPHAKAKAELHRYLQAAREALLWKLDGVSEYDARRPLVRSGTNLLGLVKHVAGVEADYLGACFDNPFEGGLPDWEEGVGPNSDMWATADESREDIIAICRPVWEHSDQTIDALGLGSPGRVPWWPEDRATVDLHQILVHVIAETNRHAGHADIVRELIDGSIGLRQGNTNLPDVDEQWWVDYVETLEATARGAADRAVD